jgi:hypothetical protein
MTAKSQKQTEQKPQKTRKDRLKLALKSNMAKRKAQAKARANMANAKTEAEKD